MSNHHKRNYNNNHNKNNNNNNKQTFDHKIMISLSDLVGTKFYQTYYRIYDYDKGKLYKFYRQNSKVIINGKVIPSNKLQEFFSSHVPNSQHRIKSCNVQPILACGLSSDPTVLLTINGVVSYLGMKPVPFTQSLILESQKNTQTNEKSYWIVSDIFRSMEDSIAD